ncbi:MAG: MoxR family ATPase [Planctomycetes bacterium]|nr:MoxR family ATPase [Planctomycetota bacterium]
MTGEASPSRPTAAAEALPVAEKLRRIRADHERIRADLRQAIVGLEAAIELLLGAIIAGGHCLLEGVPGLAKTLLVNSLGQALGLATARIQFTPDLMPSDITGADVIVQDHETGERRFRFIRGPIFTNLLLADEINRTPPRTQAALMEAMEERQVTSLGRRYELDRPFLVVATQNPIEQEATYPLPAAQLDRFMYRIQLDYPSVEEEYRIVRLTTAGPQPMLRPILGREELLWLNRAVRSHPVPEAIEAAAVALVRRTRPNSPEAPAFVREWVSWGAGPRADQFLILGARARALLLGRAEVELDDLMHVARPVLRHRILLNYQAIADGVTTDGVVERLLGEVPAIRALRAARRRPEARRAGFVGRLFGRRT